MCAKSGIAWFTISTIGVVLFATSGLSEAAMENVEVQTIMGAMVDNPSAVCLRL